MCGIVGVVSYKKDVSMLYDVIENMTEKLAPRGPDAKGCWFCKQAAFGHRRLIVVDPEGGQQPMTRVHNGNTYCICYNGELYNTEEIRSDLLALGYTFSGHSDTEVLLTSYIEWGTAFTDHLNGIFAFAIYDLMQNRVILVRDRFGVKPLFYCFRDDTLIFGSELKALLAHPDVEPVVDRLGLAEVFALGPSRTPGCGVYKDVFELEPAGILVFTPDHISIDHYWALTSKPHTDSLEQTIEKVRELVLDTIVRQLVSDVPVCTFLSGGLDSSAITAIAANHFKARGERLHTYSIDYARNSEFFQSNHFQPAADAPYVELMSKTFDTEHHYIFIETPEELGEALIDSTRARDLPGMADVDSSLLLFCREIRKQHVVALSGECADEIFGGYPWFHSDKVMQDYSVFPWMINLKEKLSVLSPELLCYIKPEEYVSNTYQTWREKTPRLLGESEEAARRRELFFLNQYWFMSLLLERKDRMSMACGLEVRVPYCDHRVAEYVWNIPWEMKNLEGREKGLLREALKGLLPDEVLFRKKSPYPKTYNPAYERVVKNMLIQIIKEKKSPFVDLINVRALDALFKEDDSSNHPWFGQLMAKPQLYAFLIQVSVWLEENNVVIR